MFILVIHDLDPLSSIKILFANILFQRKLPYLKGATTVDIAK